MDHTPEKSTGAPGRHRARLAVRAAGIGILMAVAGIAFAQSGPPQQGGGPGAPVEALAACEAKVVGDVCSMTLPQSGDKVEGLCQTTPDEKLACMPNDAPPPRQ
ncbi:hypothetical protein [Phaeovulum sp.]|uniref:hypothetical protein n=1 Tax=Phaeovulum sp. TaxID=2934796 RepID=UPI003564378D